MNWYKHYLGDYARKTAALSLVEHGVYRVLLDHYYATMQPLPQAFEALYRICRAMSDDERQAVRLISDKFFPIYELDGLRHNSRCDEELTNWNGGPDGSQSKAGKLGAEARWRNKDQSRKTRSQRLSAARQIATHTEVEWQELINICGNKCLRCNAPASELDGGVICKDHIIPVYLGGSDGIENLQPLCRNCNTAKKGDATDLRPNEWRESLSERMRNVWQMNGEMPNPPEVRSQKLEFRNHNPESVPVVRKKPRTTGSEKAGQTAETWGAYRQAYNTRYGVDPVRNAAVNGCLSRFVEKLGADEAPMVAAFYLSHNGAWYSSKGHSVQAMLGDAEKLRTEWATGRQITATGARQADRTQANRGVFEKLIAEAKAKEALENGKI